MQITTAELLKSQPEPRVGEAKLPAGIGIEYNTALQKIVREIKKDIDEQLIPVLRAEQRNYTADSWFDRIQVVLDRLRNKWNSPQFASIATQIASKFVTSVDGRVEKNLGLDVYGDDAQLQTIIDMSVFDNTRLIKTIPEQYLSQVESIVVTNTRAGNRSSAMVTALTEQFGVRSRHAKFIARDQTAEVNSAIATERMTSVGYEMFRWRTSRDSRVRDRHNAIANKITEYGPGVYRFDNPPLSDKGVPILTGQDFQCRCTMSPISRRQHERFVEQGLTVPGVKR
jgi:SPP1 gp7 family putative phage head morphogenesis protein